MFPKTEQEDACLALPKVDQRSSFVFPKAEQEAAVIPKPERGIFVLPRPEQVIALSNTEHANAAFGTTKAEPTWD